MRTTGSTTSRHVPSGRLPLVALLALALLGLTGCNVPQGFHDYVVFDGLVRPTSMELSPDGRIFVTEKRGVLKVFDGVDDTTATVVVDLRTNTYNSWDRGMLGLALHPRFPAVPDIYVAYTYDAEPGGEAPRWGQAGVDNDVCPNPPGETAAGCLVSGRISRLRMEGGAWDGVEHVLVEDFCSQFPSHTIGTLAFGADGALYAGAGDGADFNNADYGQRGGNPCGDPPLEGGALRAQDVRTTGDPVGLDGTIIRIDPTTGKGLPTNPLASSADANARRIVAAGLRNPFRFAVRPGTNDLWIGDVGWRTWEEINRTRGDDVQLDNFGWPCREGTARQAGYDSLDLPICEAMYAGGVGASPVYTYRHDQKVVDDERCTPDNGSSISGLAFAPSGSAYPERYRRALFFADATRGCIWTMGVGADGLPDPAQVSVFHHAAGTPVELDFGPDGELWFVDLYGGQIQRIGYSSTNAAPQAAIAATPTAGDVPLTVTLDGRSSSDADAGDVLSYAWDTDGDGELDDATSATTTVTYDTAGARTVRLRVTDAAGATDTASVVVRAGTAAPVPTIAQPAAGTTVGVGDSVPFSGSATAGGSGTLPASALSWGVDLLHCTTPDRCHRHPDVFTADDVASGSFTMPDHDYPAAVELRLSATWNGETSTVVRRVDYATAPVTLTAPEGVTLTLAGTSSVPPVRSDLPVGSTVTVSAPASVPVEGGTLRFLSWSDGGAATHEIVVPPGGVTLDATYVLAT
ncbi:MAG TPA: PQQ-dependent sugar dehydrogenase [Acidimicrobiales bacterium]|nr:PQQ-dependent sugar dehydrogenase [Acidimicrobiales bacterium]